jgi:zinc protease
MGLAARAQSDPARIDRWFASPDLIRAITPEELQATARKWLGAGSAVQVSVVPEASAAVK